MTEQTKRIRKAINWLIFSEVAESEKAVADMLGYTKSSFSQLVNGKVPLSEKFIKKLCSLDPNINDVYITEGVGNLLRSDSLKGENVIVIPKEAWEVIQAQAVSLSARDRQIEELIKILRDQVETSKKMLAPKEEAVTSAAAV